MQNKITKNSLNITTLLMAGLLFINTKSMVLNKKFEDKSSLENVKEQKFGDSWHFDTKILRDAKLTKQKLMEEGFKIVKFKNEAGIELAALFKEEKDAELNIIFTHGFCPGGKEGFAPFEEIAPKKCNKLFLDMTGYGDSQGSNIVLRLNTYGKDNYKDIIAAIKFLKSNSGDVVKKDLPVVLFGWCSGAFHSANAIINLNAKSNTKKDINILTDEKELDKLGVKGLVFDSGFAAISEISALPMRHLKENFFPGLFASLLYNGNKKLAAKSYICMCVWLMCFPVLKIIEMCVKPQIIRSENETGLYERISDVGQTPVLIIHNKYDNYAKCKNVEDMAEDIKNKEIWFTGENLTDEQKKAQNHADNHLKFKEEYKQRLGDWIDKKILKK